MMKSALNPTDELPEVHSFSYYIHVGVLDRLKLVVPFNACQRFALTPARPIQAEHLPFLGVYFGGDGLSPDGDANVTEPRFENELKLHFSYFVQNNNDAEAYAALDAGYWSIMKTLHDAAWKQFELQSGKIVVLESINGGSRELNLNGRLHENETPVGELQLELTYFYRMQFSPIVTDLFEVFHEKVVYPWPDDPQRQSIIVEWVLPQD